jgi:hypothetical protein
MVASHPPPPPPHRPWPPRGMARLPALQNISSTYSMSWRGSEKRNSGSLGKTTGSWCVIHVEMSPTSILFEDTEWQHNYSFVLRCQGYVFRLIVQRVCTTVYDIFLHCKEPIPKIRNKYSRKGIVQPQCQFPHSCDCKRFIYSSIDLAVLLAASGNMWIVDRSRGYINLSQTHECGNWD